MTKILPLPVKKNKFGQLVADIPVTDYYGQIMEEVLEAYKASVIFDVKKHIVNEGCGQCIEYIDYDNEPEELADVITCCVTRLDNNKAENWIDYIEPLDKLPKNFYRHLEKKILVAHEAAVFHYSERGVDAHRRENLVLIYIIKLCIAKLEHLGYDEKAREKIYAAVNEKNRRRGYFEV